MSRLLGHWAGGVIASIAALPLSAQAQTSLSLVYSGVVSANTRPAPSTPEFASWCMASGAPVCAPTTQFPVFDTHTGQPKGTAYIWGAFPFNAGSGAFAGSICFSEYMVFDLNDGEIHLSTAKNGTCGAFMDPALKPPKYASLGATAVIAGGGDGVIAAGTGRYAKWRGSFTDRVFVGFGPPSAGVGGIVYYDQLIFGITPSSN